MAHTTEIVTSTTATTNDLSGLDLKELSKKYQEMLLKLTVTYYQLRPGRTVMKGYCTIILTLTKCGINKPFQTLCFHGMAATIWLA